jgi:hypothetical protein
MRLLALSLFVLAACSTGPSAVAGDPAFGEEGEFAPPDTDGKSDSATPAGGKGSLHRLQVAHGAYPAEGAFPNVIVYTPRGFDATPPVDVVVFLHGQMNCIDTVIGPFARSCNAAKRTAPRTAHNLLAQLDATKKNAVLVVPQLARDKADSSAGAFADEGTMRLLFQDAFALVPQLAAIDVDQDLGALQVISHSGGYKAAAGIARVGGVPVTDLVNLDSFYGYEEEYFGWIEEWPWAFYLPRDRRWSVIYGTSTLKWAQPMATRVGAYFDPEDAKEFLVDDRTTATLADAQYGKSLLFKRTGMEHNALVRYYFGKLVATADLETLP